VNSAQRSALLAPEQSQTFTEFVSDWSTALDAGLTAAAEVYEEAVKARLARGYTSGRFVGEERRSVVDSVHHRRPATDRSGQRFVRVGSSHPVARLWEFGHHNRFTRRFERVEHFRNAIADAGDQMARAFHDVFQAALV
jgi:hypothetical protein